MASEAFPVGSKELKKFSNYLNLKGCVFEIKNFKTFDEFLLADTQREIQDRIAKINLCS